LEPRVLKQVVDKTAIIAVKCAYLPLAKASLQI
jgi:hypothetical protein